jgi:hypothetical protein
MTTKKHNQPFREILVVTDMKPSWQERFGEPELGPTLAAFRARLEARRLTNGAHPHQTLVARADFRYPEKDLRLSRENASQIVRLRTDEKAALLNEANPELTIKAGFFTLNLSQDPKRGSLFRASIRTAAGVSALVTTFEEWLKLHDFVRAGNDLPPTDTAEPCHQQLAAVLQAFEQLNLRHELVGPRPYAEPIKRTPRRIAHGVQADFESAGRQRGKNHRGADRKL